MDLDESDQDDEEDTEHQIELYNKGTHLNNEDSDEDLSNDPINPGCITNPIDDQELKLETGNINDLSDEDNDDVYTSQSCKESLAKFRAISQKLNKSPNSKALFVEICQEKECSTPHNAKRDIRTRCNSPKDKQHGTDRAYHINQIDLNLARDLVNILEPFYEITLIVSTCGGAQISQVVVFIDQITSHLSSIISYQRDVYPAALRNACRAGLRLTNKYYTLTDCSPLYRVAMILNPSFKDEYFKLAKWEPEWISEAVRLARDMWESQYKPLTQPPPTRPNPRPKPQTGVLARLSGAFEARTGTALSDPLTMWLAGGLNLDDEGQPVSPLKWWIAQGRAGNNHGGLLQMALDVLSCPDTNWHVAYMEDGTEEKRDTKMQGKS
ncbi:hypothetical protein PTTG_02867 [Puccinia triticina 1-1 BBBD Race 1]|uniref:HAT C-terminal dimerisation domain-containing protein n=1 Tax=Puccinia triticina (isolate 1-1 / race 1 (BBBD)) TaxID=630390 RepID=A0A180GNA9_PUCT1|nr:hypothetical protein PTTG_02867 [Puccinia triticina 1-1 BBBD Race 1]